MGQPTDFPLLLSEFPANGIRDALPVDPLRKLILCLGCSHTHGLGAERDSWPAQLETLLGADRFQTLNMGRRGYGLKLLGDWVETFASDLNLSACVWQIPLFCRQPLPSWQEEVSENFTMANGAWSLVANGTISPARFARAAEVMILRDLAQFERLLAFGATQGASQAVVLYEAGRSLDQPFHRKLHALYLTQICAISRKRGIPVVYGVEFTASAFAKAGMLLDHSHPNRKGNHFIGQSVRDILDVV